MLTAIRRPARFLAAVSAAALLLAGCSDEPPEMTPVEIPSAEVVLRSAGDGAKAPVRWIDDGAEQDVTLSVTQGFGQETVGGDGSVPNPSLPDTTMELPLQARTTGSGADRTVDMEVGEPTGTHGDLNKDLATAEGFRVRWNAGDRGDVSALAFGAPEDATETARAGVEASLRQWASLPIVFPEEPIGDRATWTVSRPVEDLGVDQEITYTLLRRDGDTVDLHVGVRQTPTVRELDGGDGVTLHVVNSQVSMTDFDLRIDLRKPLPVAGTVSYVLSVGYSGEHGEGAEPDVVQKTLRGFRFTEG